MDFLPPSLNHEQVRIMKIAPHNLNSPTITLNPQFGAKIAEEKTSLSESQTEQSVEKATQEASALAQQALAQLHFAEGSGDVAYLQKAKQLAQLADHQTSAASGYAAKWVNFSALQALAQAAKIEAQKNLETGKKLDLVA